MITSDYIGRTVYLSNSAITCQEWVIADVNHDGTSGTVDLFSKTILSNDKILFNPDTVYGGTGIYYNGSNLDNYLSSTVYNGFATEIKNALNNMNVVSKGTTIQKRIVAPSKTELGYPSPYGNVEGNIYPIFGPVSYNDCNNEKCIITMPDGSNDGYFWTRTWRDGYYLDSDIWYVWAGTGHADSCYHANNNQTVARIRFAKA